MKGRKHHEHEDRHAEDDDHALQEPADDVAPHDGGGSLRTWWVEQLDGTKAKGRRTDPAALSPYVSDEIGPAAQALTDISLIRIFESTRGVHWRRVLMP